MTTPSNTQYEVKAYKIWYDDEPDEFYIGSTKERLISKRVSKHRSDGYIGRNSAIAQLIHKKGSDFNYVQIDSCMVSNSDQRRMFEQYWIDKLKPTLNQKRAHSIRKEYRRQYSREYYHKTGKVKQQEYAKNKYKNSKRTCICGYIYLDNQLQAQKHYNSEWHIEFVKGLPISN
jgi:hypothetical protein